MSSPRRGRSAHDLDDLVLRRRRRRRRRHPLLVALLVLVVIVAVAVVGAGAGVYAFGSSCDLDALREVRIGENSFVYAADGSLLGAIPAERNRQVVPLSRVSPWMARATVAIEDRRFYEHGGIDPQGIARAVWEDVKARSVVQGGSTITQQLVRNLYISNERTVQRKLKEACLALKLNDAWSKQRILASYLNQVYYGNLAYGIEAAAQTYYSRSARELNLRQAALLAGLTQAPSAYDPFSDPERALARRDEVLAAMRDQGTITPAQHDWAARSRDLALRPGRLYKEIREPYFFGYVRDRLIQQYGAETVRSGGLRVYTTIVPRWQKAAQAAIRETLTERTDPAAAVISIEPATGAIRAMTAVVPGRRDNQFNLLSQARRQPGSTFKTFVLTAAVEKGIDPDTSYYVSAPFTYRPVEDGSCEDGSWWCVKTYDSSYDGWTSITRSTLRSDNTVYAQLTLDVGPGASGRHGTQARGALAARRERRVRAVRWAWARSRSLRSTWRPRTRLSRPAGSTPSRPGSGRSCWRTAARTRRPAGAPRRRTRVIPDWVAYEVTKILEDNVSYGTGTRAAFGRPAAGKTGTTDKHADAWFVGYTPDLSTAVWMGYQGGEIPMENVHGISVSGGSFPAEIWRRTMERTIGRGRRGTSPSQDGAAVEAVPARQVGAHVRPVLRAAGDDHDRDHR